MKGRGDTIEHMFWMTRTSTAIALTAAVFVLPLALDQCLASCELHRTTTTTSGPTCHHSSSASTRIGHLPTPCGHDHSARITSSTAAPAQTEQTLAASLALVTSQTSGETTPAATGSPALVASFPHDPLPLHLSVSLRI
jgi:hypothetical protein